MDGIKSVFFIGQKVRRMKYLIDKKEEVKITLDLQEYIILKIRCGEKEEPIHHIYFSKDVKSLLEVAIGMYSGTIKKITLLLSEEYVFIDEEITMENVHSENANVIFQEYESVECVNFVTYVYTDGLKISISDDKSEIYLKMNKLYLGLSSKNEITEICITQLNKNEIRHIKYELDIQA